MTAAGWAVVLPGKAVYVIDDEATAREFAGYLDAEVDPADVLPVLNPVAELLAWRRSLEEIPEPHAATRPATRPATHARMLVEGLHDTAELPEWERRLIDDIAAGRRDPEGKPVDPELAAAQAAALGGGLVEAAAPALGGFVSKACREGRHQQCDYDLLQPRCGCPRHGDQLAPCAGAEQRNLRAIARAVPRHRRGLSPR